VATTHGGSCVFSLIICIHVVFGSFALTSPSLANKGETGTQQDGGGLNCDIVILVISLVKCC